MTQEDKELLLKDLCARLPYGVKFKDQYGDYINVNIHNAHIEHLIDQILSGVIQMVLRPISSMTEEERYEFECYIPSCYWEKIGVEKEDTGIGFIPICEFFDNDKGIKNLYNVLDIRPIDWLNARNFDYRGLIEKGLALEEYESNILHDADDYKDGDYYDKPMINFEQYPDEYDVKKNNSISI